MARACSESSRYVRKKIQSGARTLLPTAFPTPSTLAGVTGRFFVLGKTP